jgi:putative transposase
MGQVRLSGRQRCDGVLLRVAAEVLDRRRWATREELRIAIVTWIERTYHRRRRQARLGRLTPIEYEATMTTQVALAA